MLLYLAITFTYICPCRAKLYFNFKVFRMEDRNGAHQLFVANCSREKIAI